MTLRTTLLGLTLSAMLPTSASAAPPPPCTPARPGANVSAQPEAWRRAVEALVEATGAPGQPWSCVGGEVDLVVSAAWKTLPRTDDAAEPPPQAEA
ncbi:hypothetical protein [Polyangium sp. 6x1]|uniref:hypothetical protein n=1 Tax=Polyangium sp. 6x1 TaxID=3042689 RepID=UPI002482F6A8|nr:hypothetical protein [Polyangium sp. 6x1]MDI1446018.1 hypothetical protein [Polyangium sp. 6x1]